MENVREALEWDSIPNMVCRLKDGKEALKIRISALDSAGWDFLKFQKVKKNTLYVCSVTQSVVHRMTATVTHPLVGVGKGIDVILQAGLHH